MTRRCGTYLHVDTPAEEASTYIAMAATILTNKKDVSASVYTQVFSVLYAWQYLLL